MLTIDLQDVKDPKIDLTEAKLSFSGASQGKNYHIDLEFFKEVDPKVRKNSLFLMSGSSGSIAAVSRMINQESKWQALPRHIIFNIAKKESGPYWDRLIKQTGKQWWLKADWSKWKDEDEDDDEEGKDFLQSLFF